MQCPEYAPPRSRFTHRAGGMPPTVTPQVAGENLHVRWHRPLMAFFSRRTRNRVEAEDLTQEVYVRLLARRPCEELPDSYVFQVAINLLSDRHRRESVRARFRQACRMDDQAAVDFIDPYKIAVERQSLSAICAALEKLPERTRDILILYRIEDKSQRDIADAFGISVSAVKQHVAKGLALLSMHTSDA